MSDGKGNIAGPGATEALYRMLLGIGAAAALFTGAVCVLMMATFVQLRTNDPLDDPILVQLREEYSADPGNDRLQEQIRLLDYGLRTKYFRDRDQIVTGGYLAVMGAVVMVAAFAFGGGLRKELPMPGEKVGDAEFWGAVAGARGWVAGTGVILVGITIYLALTTDTNLPGDVTQMASLPDGKPDEKPGPVSVAVKPAPGMPPVRPAATNGVGAGALSGYCPVFRGPAGSGYSNFKNVPVEWNEKDGRNILWKAGVRLGGLSSPVTWGDRIVLTGATREAREVYCFNAADGSLVWTGTYETSSAASTEYDLYQDVEALMYAAPTAAVDGERVFAMFANGELAAFDMSTGKALWSKVMGDTGDNLYGLSSSLLVYGGSVIVVFDGDSNTLSRFDGATGAVIWQSERDDNTWASPILVRTADGKTLVVNAGNAEVSGWDVETGRKLWWHDLLSGDVAPSPTAGGGLVFVNFSDRGIFGIDPVGASRVVWSVEELDEGGFSETTSMVTDGDYLYQFTGKILTCLDAATGRALYQQTMDAEASYASPMIVGDKLYLFCGGTTYVVMVGPTYELLHTNILDEHTDVSPAVADGRMYVRSAKSLYCIGME